MKLIQETVKNNSDDFDNCSLSSLLLHLDKHVEDDDQGA